MTCIETYVSPETNSTLQNPILVHEVIYEGNMGNISATILIEISIKPGIVNNIHIGDYCSPNEIKIYTALFKEFSDVFAWSYE